MEQMRNRNDKWRRRWKQSLWMVALWAAGVVSVALVAEVIRLAMEAAGLRSH